MSSTFELALDVHQKWQMYLAIRWYVNVFNLWIAIWCPWNVADVFINSLICECVRPRHWHLTSMKTWQMYLAICWVSHAFALRVGIGCPSEVTDVLDNSFIFACIQPRNWHLTSVEKWQMHLINHRCLIRFTFELALEFNQEWRMYLVIRWFVDAFNLGIGIWHPSTLAYVCSNSLICGRMLILHYFVFLVDTKGDSAHVLVMDWAWTFACKVAPATSRPGRRPSAARRSQEHPGAQQRDELV
jgi:hypothetical protein